MKQLVEYIVSNLVNHPEDVIVEETKVPGEEGLSNITIKVNPEDVGRVIGRSGKVINAIRQITRIAAIQKDLRVRVDLKDDGPPPSSESQPETEEATPEEAAPKETSADSESTPVDEAPEETKDEDKKVEEEVVEAAPILEDEEAKDK
jgi:uncharacterized protein